MEVLPTIVTRRDRRRAQAVSLSTYPEMPREWHRWRSGRSWRVFRRFTGGNQACHHVAAVVRLRIGTDAAGEPFAVLEIPEGETDVRCSQVNGQAVSGLRGLHRRGRERDVTGVQGSRLGAQVLPIGFRWRVDHPDAQVAFGHQLTGKPHIPLRAARETAARHSVFVGLTDVSRFNLHQAEAAGPVSPTAGADAKARRLQQRTHGSPRRKGTSRAVSLFMTVSFGHFFTRRAGGLNHRGDVLRPRFGRDFATRRKDKTASVAEQRGEGPGPLPRCSAGLSSTNDNDLMLPSRQVLGSRLARLGDVDAVIEVRDMDPGLGVIGKDGLARGPRYGASLPSRLPSAKARKTRRSRGSSNSRKNCEGTTAGEAAGSKTTGRCAPAGVGPAQADDDLRREIHETFQPRRIVDRQVKRGFQAQQLRRERERPQDTADDQRLRRRVLA